MSKAPSVYVAAPFIQRHQARHIADFFKSDGITVTSRWIYAEHTEEDDTKYRDIHKRGIPTTQQIREYRRVASEDLADVDAADFLFLRTWEKLGCGMYWEAGYALGKGKHVLAMGDVTSVFHYLPDVTWVGTLVEASAAMRLSYHLAQEEK